MTLSTATHYKARKFLDFIWHVDPHARTIGKRDLEARHRFTRPRKSRRPKRLGAAPLDLVRHRAHPFGAVL